MHYCIRLPLPLLQPTHRRRLQRPSQPRAPSCFSRIIFNVAVAAIAVGPAFGADVVPTRDWGLQPWASSLVLDCDVASVSGRLNSTWVCPQGNGQARSPWSAVGVGTPVNTRNGSSFSIQLSGGGVPPASLGAFTLSVGVLRCGPGPWLPKQFSRLRGAWCLCQRHWQRLVGPGEPWYTVSPHATRPTTHFCALRCSFVVVCEGAGSIGRRGKGVGGSRCGVALRGTHRADQSCFSLPPPPPRPPPPPSPRSG
jgi:hypothetical protein